MFIIVSIEGQFISHCVESGSHLRFNYALLTIGFVFISIGNYIGETGAFAVLKKAAKNGDVMACHDAGFMMIQGIGCDKDLRGGLELMSKGTKLEGDSEDLSWKSDGSATELLEPQSMFIGCEF